MAGNYTCYSARYTTANYMLKSARQIWNNDVECRYQITASLRMRAVTWLLKWVVEVTWLAKLQENVDKKMSNYSTVKCNYPSTRRG